MPQTRTDPEVIRVLREHRAALINREEDQTIRLAKSWLRIEQSLKDEMLLLALQIQDEQAKGSVITEQLLRRMSRYEKLNSQMKTEILKYNKDISIPDIEKEQMQFGLSAIQSASEAIRLTAELGVQFDKLPIDAIETYVGYLGDGTPLNRLLKEAYPDALDGVVKAFLDGAARGLNPNAIALNASRSMGIGLERITLIARTEQLKVSRSVSAQQYRESGLNGYMRRVATKDASVCMACLMLDGQKIPLNQELDDHPRGRCVAVFQINKAPMIQWEKGNDWFMRQEESLQRQMMGNDKFEAWQDGQFKLEDMAKIQKNDTWGDSPRVATLGELLGGAGSAVAETIPPNDNLPSGDIQQGERFKSNEIADERLQETIDIWTSNLSDNEKAAIEEYTNDGYTAMNDALRNDTQPDKDLAETIKLTQEAISKAPPTPIDLQVTRGFKYQNLYDAIQNGQINVGDTLTDKGFMSTSVMNNIRDQKNQINYDIFIPKGSTGVAYLDGVSGIPEEAELLFGSNIPLAIRDIKIMPNGGVTVILELLQ